MIYRRVLEDRIIEVLKEKKTLTLGALILYIAADYPVAVFDAMRQRIYRAAYNLERGNIVEIEETYKGKKLIYKISIK